VGTAINAREAEAVSVTVHSQLAPVQRLWQPVGSISSPHGAGRAATPSLDEERRAEHVPHTRGRTITVALGRLDALVSNGVERVFDRDPRVRVIVAGLDDVQLEHFIMERAPDVAILGKAVHYPLLSRLKTSGKAIGLVVLAPDPGCLCGEMLVNAGAACLAQSAPEESILAAVCRAARGEPTYLPAEVEGVAPVVETDTPLTKRETAVFELLSKGLTNQQVADALQISPGTVGTHVHRIFRKLDVHSRLQLVGMPVPQRKR
jgi:two-component system, NarL family, nitrate/nitrite response regulator NarL